MNIVTSSVTTRSLVNGYSDKMYSWSLYKTNTKEAAEDLAQETFIATFQSFEKFKKKSEPKPWFLDIINPKIVDHFRKIYPPACCK